MKQSWGFLIARQYNYQFENFYTVVIQRAYKNYKKRPKSLAKQVWEAVRNDGTPDDKKFLDIVPHGKTYHFINGKLIESNYVSNRFYVENKHNIFRLVFKYNQIYFYFADTWVKAKKNQLYRRLCTIAYIATFRVLYQQGYIVVGSTGWSDMLKWLQNPKYYHINKKYNFENIIRISDCEKYRGKSTEIQRICDSLPLEFIYYIHGKDVTINFSNLGNNCELVRLIFQIRS